MYVCMYVCIGNNPYLHPSTSDQSPNQECNMYSAVTWNSLVRRYKLLKNTLFTFRFNFKIANNFSQ